MKNMMLPILEVADYCSRAARLTLTSKLMSKPRTPSFWHQPLLPILAALVAVAWPATARDMAEFFSQNCAACHGKDLQGGSAKSLLTGEWSHGSDDESLAQQELRRLVLDERRVTGQEVLFKNIGRVRDVCSGPDGFIYVALNGPDNIIRLEPVP
jgi:hypothetical protein